VEPDEELDELVVEPDEELDALVEPEEDVVVDVPVAPPLPWSRVPLEQPATSKSARGPPQRDADGGW
jgi:hypothetical protein